MLAKQNFSLLIWNRQLKLMLQHPTVWSDRKQLKYPSKELLLYDFLHKRSTWCLKDCDKQRLQTTVSINLSKSFAGHTGDWFDVKTASICTTELWDALKNFILTSLKIKVAPYPIIVSLDTLRSNIWQLLALSWVIIRLSLFQIPSRKSQWWLRSKRCIDQSIIDKQRGIQIYMKHIYLLTTSRPVPLRSPPAVVTVHT